MSREHVVTRALFVDDVVTVQGFPWCKAEPIKIGLQNLTAKILCGKHNNDLSDVDSVGAKAFDALREATHLSNVRGKLKPIIWRIVRYHIDGPKLERWFLKTLINIAFGRENRIGKDSLESGLPSRRLVEIAFGLGQFEERTGLSAVVHVGQQIQSTDTVSFAPLIKDASYVTGGLFAFRGVRHFLSLDLPGLIQLPRGIGVPGEDWSFSQLNFHNQEMRAMVGKHLSHVIHCHW
jgi:hypothetical protein